MKRVHRRCTAVCLLMHRPDGVVAIAADVAQGSLRCTGKAPLTLQNTFLGLFLHL